MQSINFKYFHSLFLSSQIPCWLIDIGMLKGECEQLRLLELVDIDEYIALERRVYDQGMKLISSLAVNRPMLDILGLRSETQFAAFYYQIFSSERSELISQLLSMLTKEEESAHFDLAISTIEEKSFFYSVYVDIIQFEGKELASLFFIDISNQKKELSGFNEVKEKYRLLLNASNDAMFTIDCESGLIEEINTQAEILFHRTAEELIGVHYEYLIPLKEHKRYRKLFDQQAGRDEVQSNFESFILDEFEEFIPVQVNLTTGRSDSRMIAQISFHDVRNRRQLEERRRLLATAVEQAAESVMITDLQGKIEYVNPAFEETSGFEFAEVVGKSSAIFRNIVGTGLEKNLMRQEIENGKVWRGTFTNRRKDGDKYEEAATITPVKDNEGKNRHYVTVKRDITQQIALEKQMRQSQKMQAIGTLAGGVAHDFNNILTAILGYAELCQVKSEKNTILYNNLEEIIVGAERAGKLIDQILKFSRQSEKSISTLQIDLIVKEVLKLLRASLPANIEIVANLTKGVLVKADPTQIHQVMLNLCTNAYQALEGKGGEIKVELGRVELSPREGLEIGNLSHGNYVQILVEDNGYGIPKEYMARIFEPYFSTKQKHEGTGLGLSVVHGIVNDHRGAVNVESNPGKGTKFIVYLPEAEEVEVIKEKEKELLKIKSGRILVVDDEPQIASLQQQVLERLGYEVVSCFTSEDALELYKKEGREFDLIITDMGMPEMTGLELFENIKMLNPDVRVMICTGYSKQVTRETALELGFSGFLSKPFNANDLIREVGASLSLNE